MKHKKFISFLLIFLLCQLSFAQTSDKTEQKDFPVISSNLLNEEILLIDNKTKVTLKDFDNKVIILSFIEAWAAPAVLTALFLDKFKSEKSNKNLEIIAVSSENSKEEKLMFQGFVKKNKLKIQTGWADEKFRKEFFKIADITGIPLSFVIRDGKLQGMFIKGTSEDIQNMANLVNKLLKE